MVNDGSSTQDGPADGMAVLFEACITLTACNHPQSVSDAVSDGMLDPQVPSSRAPLE